MDERTLQELLCKHHHLRVGEHTARYLLAKLTAPGKKPRHIPLLAQHALTGKPCSHSLDPADLTQPSLF